MWVFLDSCCSRVGLSAHAHRYFILISDVTIGVNVGSAVCPLFLSNGKKKGETKYMIYF